MAMTNTERATLYSALADAIGEQDAETLMEQFPPSGWDQVATKDDLRVLGAGFTAALAETNAAMKAGFAEAAKERAEIVKSQARQLYVFTATIVAATVSIWIALLTSAGAG